MDKYIPPYDITEEMLELTSEITEDLGKLQQCKRFRKASALTQSEPYQIHSIVACH